MLYCTWLNALDLTSHSLCVKKNFCYLKGVTDLGLFYTHESSREAVAPSILGFIPALLVTQMLVICLTNVMQILKRAMTLPLEKTAISWRSAKQTLVVASSNHAEILALHEALRECFWLKAVMEHIRSTSGLTTVVDLPTTIFEDNVACIEQLKKGYIKGGNTKHIVPKFFFILTSNNNIRTLKSSKYVPRIT